MDEKSTLVKVFGYGGELADGLHRYVELSGLDSAAARKTKGDIRELFGKWLGNSPTASHICFADITFWSLYDRNTQDLGKIVTLVFTPKVTRSYKNYKRVLNTFVAQGNSLAMHPVFRDGFPTVGKDFPLTAGALADFHVNHSREGYETGWYYSQLCGPKDLPNRDANQKSHRSVAFNVDDASADEDSDTALRASAPSTNSIADQWSVWKDLWRTEALAARQLSNNRRPPGWLCAAPVGVRDPYDPSQFTLVAGVFLAVDDCAAQPDLFSALRYVMLHLYDANATAQMLREGKDVGKNAAILPAAHELDNVINVFRPGLSQQACNTVATYFRKTLIEPIRASQRGTVLKATDALNLSGIISAQLAEAARLEKLVEQAKTGAYTANRADDVDREREHFVNEVLDKTAKISPGIYDLVDWPCDRTAREWFERAVLAAIRNIFQHTMLNKDVSIEFYLVSVGDKRLLRIVNKSLDARDWPGAVAKSDGTLGTLRLYARNYGSEYQDVSLTRVDDECRTIVPWEEYLEVWATVLPFPRMLTNP